MESTVLYAEDDLNDVTLMELVVSRCGRPIQLFVVRDGSQAIAYLQRDGKYSQPASSPRPALVLLDVKMPKLNGMEVLEWIRRQPSLADVPVVMISSSMQDIDVLRSYELGANAYIGKPAGFRRFQQAVHGALNFFLQRFPQERVRRFSSPSGRGSG
jgi:CheY-like chemotaxis protein